GGNNTLTIMGGGAFVGAVTNVTTFGADSIDTEATLTASTVTVSGTADLGGDVTTTGEQQYGGAVTLTGDVLLTGVDTDANGAGVEFAGTV
ncbi:hypothetical protein, partial [Maioricimonas sp. JC845]|uniref:hypothetical protein n=1 Tax=Maioricimonas sp. JC845 TaxID=3232138 RepID=UPI00345B2126